MTRAAELLVSESEADGPRAGSVKRKYTAKKGPEVEEVIGNAVVSDCEEENAEKENAEEQTAEEQNAEEEDEEEGEYEIEQILQAKKGHFPNGRMGYLVKWKGYGQEHNSWVDEDDAANAKELIDDFWVRRRRHKAGARQSEPMKPKPKSAATKPLRKSLAHDYSHEPEELAPKKRGRPKKTTDVDSDVEEMDVDEESRTKKKPRKSDGAAGKADKPSSDEEEIGPMKEHVNAASWEHLVESVDTVERDEDGELFVYFTLRDGKTRVRENSRLCAKKFPQKLIEFYESNLRWRIEN